MPKPFSAKQKKAQLQAKRDRLRHRNDGQSTDDDDFNNNAPSQSSTFGFREPVVLVVPPDESVRRLVEKTGANLKQTEKFVSARGGGGSGKAAPSLVSVFAKLSAKEIDHRKRESQKPLKRVPQSALEIGFDDLYEKNKIISFPQRPPWSKGESKETVEEREEKYFQDWLDDIYSSWNPEDLSYFEHNLEVWRQLWRVVEISDIILFVVDARHPILHFPPTLFSYVVTKMRKKLVLVFNKIDLIDSPTLAAWSKYFESHHPGLHTASFSVYPPEAFLPPPETIDAAAPATRTKISKRVHRYVRAVGVSSVLKACRDVEIYDSKGKLVDWEKMIAEEEAEKAQRELEEESRRLKDLESDRDVVEMGDLAVLDDVRGGGGRKQRHRLERENMLRSSTAAPAIVTAEGLDESEDDEENDDLEPLHDDERISKEPEEGPIPRNDLITIGLIGHPNVGKSSLINGILGKKVVSTSATPGHTKHFQTIHLTKLVRLCDCPGLVFPAVLPKPVQILSGMYKIAQVQEPYSAVQYLAERVPIEKVLNLQPPIESDGSSLQQKQNHQDALDSYQWSAWDICEAFALQRGFLTPRVARPDVYRAANLLLRMANDGRLLLGFKPPGYFSELQRKLQAREYDGGTKKYTGSNNVPVKSVLLRKGKEEVESDDGVWETESDDQPPAVTNKKGKAKGNAFALLANDD
ncbi:Guanine nucleotide-binding-like protein 1 [Rhizoclosmatium sp. JEL0117]|nr:Guanine nucleotide-binding-like protein 1 [Rhizoclosmatium sp. JEL0117]